MSSTETATPEAPADDQPPGWGKLDTLGVIAGLFLVAIVADILTDGRLISRRLRKPRQPETEAAPGE